MAQPLSLPTPLLLLAPPAHPAAPPTPEAIDAELNNIDALIADKDWVIAEVRAELRHHPLKRAHPTRVF